MIPQSTIYISILIPVNNAQLKRKIGTVLNMLKLTTGRMIRKLFLCVFFIRDAKLYNGSRSIYISMVCQASRLPGV